MVFTRIPFDVVVGANCNTGSIPLSGNETKVVHIKNWARWKTPKALLEPLHDGYKPWSIKERKKRIYRSMSDSSTLMAYPLNLKPTKKLFQSPKIDKKELVI